MQTVQTLLLFGNAHISKIEKYVFFYKRMEVCFGISVKERDLVSYVILLGILSEHLLTHLVKRTFHLILKNDALRQLKSQCCFCANISSIMADSY